MSQVSTNGTHVCIECTHTNYNRSTQTQFFSPVST